MAGCVRADLFLPTRSSVDGAVRCGLCSRRRAAVIMIPSIKRKGFDMTIIASAFSKNAKLPQLRPRQWRAHCAYRDTEFLQCIRVYALHARAFTRIVARVGSRRSQWGFGVEGMRALASR